MSLNQAELFKSDQVSTPPEDYSFEISSALVLPTCFYNSEDHKGKEFLTRFRHIDEEVYESMEMTTVSEEGPLQALELDVILVLMTLTEEQQKAFSELDGSGEVREVVGPVNKFFSKEERSMNVFFTSAEICKRLRKVPQEYAGHVLNAIRRIASQKVTTKNFLHNSATGRMGTNNDLNGSPLIRLKRVDEVDLNLEIDGNSNYRVYFKGTWNSDVYQNLYNNYKTVINSNLYHELKSGIQRRSFIFISALKDKKLKEITSKEGEGYPDDGTVNIAFYLNDLASSLGNLESKKRDRTIKKALTSINQKHFEKYGIELFRHTVVKLRGKPDWSVVMKFLNIEELQQEGISFYSRLVGFYGTKLLGVLSLKEDDIELYRASLKRKIKKANLDPEIKHGKELVPLEEYLIDLHIWQERQRFELGRELVKSPKAYIESLLESHINDELEVPDKFSSCLNKRLNDLREEQFKKEETVERRKKRQEAERIRKIAEDHAKSMFDSVKKQNGKVFEQYLEKAKEITDLDLDCPTMKTLNRGQLEKDAENLFVKDYVSDKLPLNDLKNDYKKEGLLEEGSNSGFLLS